MQKAIIEGLNIGEDKGTTIEEDYYKKDVNNTTNYIYVSNNILHINTKEPTKESIENKEYKGLPNYFGDNLYIFDWNGQLIDSYLLDIPVCSFCVDSSNKYIIASSIDGESFILKKYNLNMP